MKPAATGRKFPREVPDKNVLVKKKKEKKEINIEAVLLLQLVAQPEESTMPGL